MTDKEFSKNNEKVNVRKIIKKKYQYFVLL